MSETMAGFFVGMMVGYAVVAGVLHLWGRWVNRKPRYKVTGVYRHAEGGGLEIISNEHPDFDETVRKLTGKEFYPQLTGNSDESAAAPEGMTNREAQDFLVEKLQRQATDRQEN